MPHHLGDRCPRQGFLGNEAVVPPTVTQYSVVLAVAAGGVIGALARYGIATAVPTGAGHFPLATLIVNVLGCLLIGVLSALVTDVWPGRPLIRPFLGTGLLGGFTTFSSYALDIRQLLAAGHLVITVAYLVGTVTAALGAVHLGVVTTRTALSRCRCRQRAAGRR